LFGVRFWHCATPEDRRNAKEDHTDRNRPKEERSSNRVLLSFNEHFFIRVAGIVKPHKPRPITRPGRYGVDAASRSMVPLVIDSTDTTPAPSSRTTTLCNWCSIP
jgi:hypothetical protein